MTDDLDMGAITNEAGIQRPLLNGQMLAGNHLAMICHRVHLIEEARAALETVERSALDRALAGVDRFKRKMAAPKPFSEERFQRWTAKSGTCVSPLLGRRRPLCAVRTTESVRLWKFTKIFLLSFWKRYLPI